MILGGHDGSHGQVIPFMEAIDVNDADIVTDLTANGMVIYSATGTFMDSLGAGLICGGITDKNSDKCFTVSPGNQAPTLTMSMTMSKPRVFAASIRWQHQGEEALWITGGETDQEFQEEPEMSALKSTEFIAAAKGMSYPGQELPRPLTEHCLIKLNESHAMIVAGMAQYFDGFIDWMTDAYIYSSNEEKWQIVSQNLQQRYRPICGLVVDKTTKERMVVVADDSTFTEAYFLDNVGHWTVVAQFPGLASNSYSLTSANNEELFAIDIYNTRDFANLLDNQPISMFWW